MHSTHSTIGFFAIFWKLVAFSTKYRFSKKQSSGCAHIWQNHRNICWRIWNKNLLQNGIFNSFSKTQRFFQKKQRPQIDRVRQKFLRVEFGTKNSKNSIHDRIFGNFLNASCNKKKISKNNPPDPGQYRCFFALPFNLPLFHF